MLSYREPNIPGIETSDGDIVEVFAASITVSDAIE